jgi:hypothetical protein
MNALDDLYNRGGVTNIEYDVTPPTMPVGFSVKDLEYRGDYQ